MSRSTLVLAAVLGGLAVFAPANASGQPFDAPRDPAAVPVPAVPAPSGPLGLDFDPGRAPAERGIEDATTGVWVGGAVGAVLGGLTASWAYCTLGEGDCGFSITAAGPGILIGAILGASIGGLLDDGDESGGSE